MSWKIDLTISPGIGYAENAESSQHSPRGVLDPSHLGSTLKTITPIPPTPMPLKKTRSIFQIPSAPKPKKDLFPGKQELSPDPLFQGMQAYKLKEVPHSVYQQKSSKDCGGAALLMLFTDVMRKNSSFNLDPEFLKWVAHSYNRNADEIIEQATQKGLQASKESLNKENALSIIQSHIEQTHLPVIVSITHPIIEGHWITVDGIHEGIVYIRDPHSGGAYAIPSETFLSYLDKNIEQCISFRDC